MNAADVIAYAYNAALICPACAGPIIARERHAGQGAEPPAPVFASEEHEAPSCCDLCQEPLDLPLTEAGRRGVIWLDIAAQVLRTARESAEREGDDQAQGEAFDTAAAAWLLATDHGHRVDLAGTHGGAPDVLRALDVAGFRPDLSLRRLAGSSALERFKAGEEILDDNADGLAVEQAAAWLSELEG